MSACGRPKGHPVTKGVVNQFQLMGCLRDVTCWIAVGCRPAAFRCQFTEFSSSRQDPPNAEQASTFIAIEPHQPSPNVPSQASFQPKPGPFHSPASSRFGVHHLADAQLERSASGPPLKRSEFLLPHSPLSPFLQPAAPYHCLAGHSVFPADTVD